MIICTIGVSKWQLVKSHCDLSIYNKDQENFALLIILKITIIVLYLDFVICFIKILLKLKTLLFKNLLAGSTAGIYRITRSTF